MSSTITYQQYNCVLTALWGSTTRAAVSQARVVYVWSMIHAQHVDSGFVLYAVVGLWAALVVLSHVWHAGCLQ